MTGAPANGGPRVLLIANPHAASYSRERRELVAGALGRRCELELVTTGYAGHGREAAQRAAAQGVDVVATIGGDGTINEAVNGLGAQSGAALYPLPGGSANVLARIVGVPSDLVDATSALIDALARPAARLIDLASVDGRLFTFASGVGLDAAVVERVDASPGAKRRYGPWFFAATAVHTFARRYALRPVPRLELRPAGGEWVDGVTAVIQNGRPYTYFGSRAIDVSRAAGIESGRLAAAVLRSASARAIPSLASRALRPGGAIGDDGAVVELQAAGSFELRGAGGAGLPLHVDGDYIGEVAGANYRVHAGALRLLAADAQSALPGVTR